jgi:hypothetical protein
LLARVLGIIGLVTVILVPWLIQARERSRIHTTLSNAAERGIAYRPTFSKH